MRRETPLKRNVGLKRTPLKARTDSSFTTKRQVTYRLKSCGVCGLEFAPTAGIQKYCGPGCRAKAELIEYTCEHCGGAFFRPRSRGWRFCSPRCANTVSSRARSRAPRGSRAGKHLWGVATKGELLCRNCGAAAVNLHHIVPRSKSKAGLSNVAGNGLPLCFACHRGWHDRVVVIHHHALNDEEFSFVTRTAGSEWIRRNYPDGFMPEVLTLYFARTGHWLDRDAGTPEPLRLRTLRLLGLESVPEPSPTGARGTA